SSTSIARALPQRLSPVRDNERRRGQTRNTQLSGSAKMVLRILLKQRIILVCERGRDLEAYGKLPRMPCSPNASYFAGAALSVVCEGLFRQPVQPTGCSILLDLAIEASGLEFLEPSAKPSEVV